jgi:hypothetical protein
MILKYAAVVSKTRVSNHYQAECIVCGGNSSNRILVVIDDNGKRKKKSICFSRGKDCFYGLFSVLDIDRPYFAGKVMKRRDSELTCVNCRKSAVGGLWVSMHGINKFSDRKAICINCLDGLTNI